ncbi:MAG: hypothetical protein ABIH39_04570 [Candidatus Margulisiibacteriota bacterium]
MAKQWEKGFHDIDIYSLVRKDNRKLITALLLSLIINILLGVLLVYNREPQIKLLRLYENIEKNATTIIDDSLTESITKSDLLLLVKYAVEHYDLKSSNTLLNYKILLSISEGTFLKQLKDSQDSILIGQYNAKIDKVINEIIGEPEIKTEKTHVVVKVKYSQLILYKNGNDEEKEKAVTLAFQKVDRRRYENKKDLGGWFYGLVLVQVSDPINSI